MAEREDSPDDSSEQDRPDESKDNQTSQRSTEDVVFPEAYRKFWRTLLGGWRRR